MSFPTLHLLILDKVLHPPSETTTQSGHSHIYVLEKRMDAFIFIIILATFLFVFNGYRKYATYTFFLSLFLIIVWFGYHATDTLNINI